VNLATLLSQHAQERGPQPAIVQGRGANARFTTFAQLDENARRAAGFLSEHGIQPGSRVLLLQPMSAELYEALLALFRLGAIAVVLDPGAGLKHVAACCEIARPEVLIGCWRAHLLRAISPALRSIRQRFVIGAPFPGATRWSSVRQHEPIDDVFTAGRDAPALLTFTSGSTGQPKGALRSHGLLLAQHRAIAHALELTPGEVDLSTLPIFLLANLASGVTSVIPDADLRRPGAINPEPVLDQVREHAVTQCVASPAFFERLLAAPAEKQCSLKSIRKAFTGGAPVGPRLISRLAAAMPRARIFPVYGSTEAEPIAHFEQSEMTERDALSMRWGRGLLAGHPVPEVQLRIIKDAWGRVIEPLTGQRFASLCLPAGEAGEIVVSGAHVLPGYLNGHGNAETKFQVDGAPWHRTGDAGYLDESGRLWLLGRCMALISDASGTLWPFAVEYAAQEYPGVRRAALVQLSGRRVLAVEAEPGADVSPQRLTEMLEWAKLDEVRMMAAIPLDRRHNAKVDYSRLRRLLEA
jgi:acyl-CoA synthetase (AMP-forming)/AMP-acid ligase II